MADISQSIYTNAARAKWYEENKPALLERIRKWQLDNPLKRKATVQKYYQEHKTKAIAATYKYRKSNPERHMHRVARHRAETRGLEFNIEVSDIIITDTCPLLGVPMSLYSEDKDYRPSLDRIDSAKGYIKGNIHVICYRANRLKNNATPDEILTLALNLLRVTGDISWD